MSKDTDQPAANPLHPKAYDRLGVQADRPTIYITKDVQHCADNSKEMASSLNNLLKLITSRYDNKVIIELTEFGGHQSLVVGLIEEDRDTSTDDGRLIIPLVVWVNDPLSNQLKPPRGTWPKRFNGNDDPSSVH